MSASITLDFQQARINHLLFKSRLRAILYGDGDPTDSRVLSQYACAVGKWLYGHALIHYESIPAVQLLEEVHGQLHQLARNLITRYQQGHVDEARQGLVDMETLADRMVALLEDVEEQVNGKTIPQEPVSPSPDNTLILRRLLARNERLDDIIRQRTGRAVNQHREQEARQPFLYNFFMQSPAAFCILQGPRHVVELANPEFQRLIGNRNPLGKPVREALPDLDGQGFFELLDNIYTTQEAFTGKSVPATIVDATGQSRSIYVDFTYQPTVDATGTVDGVLVFAYDVTEQVMARQQIEASEARFRALIEQAPVATCLFVGRSLRIEQANDAMLRMWGKGDAIIGKPLAEALPELRGQPFLRILDDIFVTGKTYTAVAEPCDLLVGGVLSTYYFDFTYKPLFDDRGQVYAIMDMATDVTQQVLSSQKLEESEQFARSLFENSPAAKLVLVGQDLRIRTTNENMLTMLGRDDSIIGQPFMDVVPELMTSSLLDSLRHVLTTGETYYQSEERIDFVRHGQTQTGYYNYISKALYTGDQKPYGVFITAIDVTEQVLSRQKVEQAENLLRGAVELAELATWQIDLTTGVLDYSERMRFWCGIGPDEIITIERAFRPIRKADHQRVREAMEHALTPGTDGIYAVEYTLDAAEAGQERIVRVQGRAYLDEQSRAHTVTGMAQDVTEQRSLQLALEQRVQERTEELAASNEELTAASEAISEANRGLEEANVNLVRSNQNLEQFAYVASHDLQEPLRKIQQFGDLLRNRYARPDAEELVYLDRMQSAAARMSQLIKDLLAFSRISTSQATTDAIALNRVVEEALDNLSVAIHETRAQVQVDPLPTILGDASQLGQLFMNLLSNALKFSSKDQAGQPAVPCIAIRASRVSATKLPTILKPARPAETYYRIDVTDNGVGFDEKYLDRIFQVFQRLHGKNEFSGTGVGLAICQKVVANHGGAITASSQAGEGAVFSVYFPA